MLVECARTSATTTTTHVVVPAEEYEERTGGWGHLQQPPIRKNVVPQSARAIVPAHAVDLRLGAPIQHAQIEVAARIIDQLVARRVAWVPRVGGLEDTVYDEVREGEEEGGDAAGVFLEFVAQEEGVEDEAGVGEEVFGQAVL